MKKISPCILFLILLGVSWAQELTLQQQADSLYVVYRLDEVVVYGKRYIPAPSMMTEILEAEIPLRQGSTVADLLRTDPGLIVTTGSKAETETRIRGFDARNVLVLVDGRPINPGYYGKADLSMLPKDQISKIKVIKGPASVAYGANGMGGVINIVTKNGLGTPSTLLDTEFGGHGYRKTSLNHSGQKGSWHYWLSGYENAADGFPLSDDFTATSLEDGDLRDNSAYQKAGIQGKLGRRLGPTALISLAAGYHWAQKDCPWTIHPSEGPQFRRFPQWERYGAALSGQWSVTSSLEIKSVLFGDAYHDRFKSYATQAMDEDRLDYDSALENWTLGGSVEALWQVANKHHLHTGFHLRRDLMNKKPDVDEDWFSHHFLTLSVFAEERFIPWMTSTITLGVSYNLFQNENRNEITRHLSPMVSIHQVLPWHFSLRGSWARAVRFPTMHQLFSESSGNSDLKPEEADKWEIGLEREITLPLLDGWRGSAEVAVFSNDLQNLIYRASRTYRHENITDARIRGWEARLALQKSAFSARISCAFLDPAVSSKELMEEVPEFQLGVTMSWCTSFGTSIFYQLHHLSERTTYIPSWNLSSYQVHHFTLTQYIVAGIEARVRFSNFLDTAFEEELGYPGAGRQIQCGIMWRR